MLNNLAKKSEDSAHFLKQIYWQPTASQESPTLVCQQVGSYTGSVLPVPYCSGGRIFIHGMLLLLTTQYPSRNSEVTSHLTWRQPLAV